jgi:hypothetical protein
VVLTCQWDDWACFWHACTLIWGQILVSARIMASSVFKWFVLIDVRCLKYLWGYAYPRSKTTGLENVESLTSQPYRLLRPVTGIDSTYFYYCCWFLVLVIASCIALISCGCVGVLCLLWSLWLWLKSFVYALKSVMENKDVLKCFESWMSQHYLSCVHINRIIQR